MGITQKDVAREAGVSVATVSRVLNNIPAVDTATRARVLDVMQRLGYVCSAAGRMLSRRKSNILGVLFHQMSSGFFARVMAGIDTAAQNRGYCILSAFTHDDADREKSAYAMMAEMQTDGLLVLDSGLSTTMIERLRQAGQPFILMQREPDDDLISSVSAANHAGAFMMMAHLRRKAYNRILILKGPSGAQDARQRLAGCLAQVKEQPVPTLQIDCAEGGYDAEQAVKAFRKYRAAHGLPRAVFALNDAMALAVLKECRYRDIAVPEEVAVAGFDGIQCAAYMGLTTIQTPMTELGRTAVQKLVEYIENTHHKPERIRLPGRLIVRETT